MNRRKGIPLVALIIFFALLVAIIITCAIILGTNKNKKSNNTQQNPEQQPTIENPPETPEEYVEEELEKEEYINSDSSIKEAFKLTGNYKTYAKYGIYLSGGFNNEDNPISNELKLQLAMSQVTAQDMDSESSTKAVPKEKIEEYVSKIFEDTSVEYKDFSLYNSDTNFTEEYRTIGYVYNEDDDNYEIQENTSDEEYPPEITELITKVIKYNSKIEIFVTPLFIRPYYSDEYGDVCELYSNYDFESKEFSDEYSLTAFKYSDFNDYLKSDYNGDADGYNYDELSKQIDINNLQQYKYTLKLVDGGYKLDSFEKSTSNVEQPKEDEGNGPLTADEKSAINFEIEEFVGNDIEGNKMEDLLNTIIDLNTKNSSREDFSIIVTLNGTKTEETDDIDSLNEEIKGFIDEIDSSASYTVKPVYKSGLITSINITENEE